MVCGINFKVAKKLIYRIVKTTLLLFLCITQLSLTVSPVFAQNQLDISLPSTASVQPSYDPTATPTPAPTAAPTPALPTPQPTQTTTNGSIPDDIASFFSTVATLNNPVHLVNPQTGFERVSMPAFTLSIPEKSNDQIGTEKTKQWNSGNEQINATIIDSSGNQSPAIIKKTAEGQFVLQPTTNNLTPGNYSIQVSAKESFFYTRTITQNFSWGIIALNTNKSIYNPGDTVQMSIGMVNQKGITQCDSLINMTVTNPNGQTTQLSTSNGSITRSTECLGDTYSAVPDYSANYQTTVEGNYTIAITATTEAGSYSISDSFKVSNNIPFDVERVSFPTRVYPLHSYNGEFIIKPKVNFSGNVVESVPSNFSLYNISDNGVQNVVGNRLQVTWNVNWTAGQTYQLSYGINFPLKSPAYYLLGPLKIGNVFKEARQWEVANDATSCWDGASGANWSVATNWSPNGVPPSTNIATFGGCGGTNLNATIDTGSTVNVLGIAITSAYTQTITDSETTNTTTIGTSGFSQAGGTFNAGSNTINDAGEFSLTGGTFTAGTSTVNLDDVGQAADVVGNITFYNLSATTPAENITFTAGDTTTVSNGLTLVGGSTSDIDLRSTTTGSNWYLIDNGTDSLSNLSVEDSNACGGSTSPLSPSSSVNVSNNFCWNFSTSGWYNGNWLYRMPITINAAQVTATPSAPLYDFPVLVTVASNSALLTHVQFPNNGQDIVFTDDSGTTELPYEIEEYLNGTVDAWVNLPYLSNAQNTLIYMYYDNPTAPGNTSANIHATWPNYSAVYHLNNNNFNDSTVNGNNLTNELTTFNPHPLISESGRTCLNDNTTGDFLLDGTITNLPAANQTQTLSAWGYFTTGQAPNASPQSADNENLTASTNPSGAGSAVQFGYRDEEYIAWNWSGGSIVNCGIDVPSANTWHYFVYSWDGSYNRLYIDGVMCGHNTTINSQFAAETTMAVCDYASSGTAGGNEEWVGEIDEARIAEVGRSPTWISTEYNNVDNPSTFLTIGSETVFTSADVDIRGGTKIRGGTTLR